MAIFFDADDLTDEPGHWLSLMMHQAIATIDERLGKGFAESHSDLVGAYLLSGAMMISTKKLNSAIAAIASALTDIGTYIDRLDMAPPPSGEED